jgi:hypothetical protein
MRTGMPAGSYGDGELRPVPADSRANAAYAPGAGKVSGLTREGLDCAHFQPEGC